MNTIVFTFLILFRFPYFFPKSILFFHFSFFHNLFCFFFCFVFIHILFSLVLSQTFLIIFYFFPFFFFTYSLTNMLSFFFSLPLQPFILLFLFKNKVLYFFLPIYGFLSLSPLSVFFAFTSYFFSTITLIGGKLFSMAASCYLPFLGVLLFLTLTHELFGQIFSYFLSQSLENLYRNLFNTRFVFV